MMLSLNCSEGRTSLGFFSCMRAPFQINASLRDLNGQSRIHLLNM